MKKIISVFAVILILMFAFLVAYLRVPFVQEKVADVMDDNFERDNIYTDLESISKRLEQEILKGSDSFVIYLKGMDINEINNLNDGMDGIFGSGESYQKLGTVGDNTKVSITIKKSINYYAYDAYVNGTPIPEGEEKAKALYKKIKLILDTQISETMTDYEKELALHDYLVAHCVYSEEKSQSPENDIYRAYGALVKGDAVCNGYAEALQLLFYCCGIHSRFVIGTCGDLNHAWNLVELDGKWYHLDATWDDPYPDRGEELIHPYFNLPDEIMKNSHDWDASKYPEAFSMEDNYYVKEGLYFSSFDEYRKSAYDKMVVYGQPRYEAVIYNYKDKEDDMRFVFENSDRYNNVNWQTFNEGTYNVLVINAE